MEQNQITEKGQFEGFQGPFSRTKNRDIFLWQGDALHCAWGSGEKCSLESNAMWRIILPAQIYGKTGQEDGMRLLSCLKAQASSTAPISLCSSRTLVPTASLCRASERAGSYSRPYQSPTLLLQAFSFPCLFPCSHTATSTNSRWDWQLLGRGNLSLLWQQHGCLLGKYTCTSKTSPLLMQDELLSALVEHLHTAVQQGFIWLWRFLMPVSTCVPPWL